MSGVLWGRGLRVAATLLALAGVSGPPSARAGEADLRMCGAGNRTGVRCDEIRSRAILEAQTAPWSAIGRVNFATHAQTFHCTGVLISPRQVLTAAHCLYNGTRGAWVAPQDVTFAAGYQRGSALAAAKVQSFETGWRGGQKPVQSDWAILQLSEPLGDAAGVIPLASAGTSVRGGFVVGYPGLRSHVQSRTARCGGAVTQGAMLRAFCPLMGGDSGAPYLVETEQGLRVRATISGVQVTHLGVEAWAVPVERIPAEALGKD